jgi:hypothetical protein
MFICQDVGPRIVLSFSFLFISTLLVLSSSSSTFLPTFKLNLPFIFPLCFFFFFLISTGVRTQDLALARHLGALPLEPLVWLGFVLFCFSCFLDRVLSFCPRAGFGPQSSYLCLPGSWDCRYGPLHLASL